MKNKNKKSPRRRHSYHGKPDLWRRDGHFYAIWTEDGKTKTKSLKTTDIIEAEERLKEFRTQIHLGETPSIKPPTVHEAVDQWLEWKKLQVSAGTISDYRYFGNKMKGYFGATMSVTEMTGQKIEAYLLHLKNQGLAGYSVKTQLGALHAVFSRLVRQRVIPYNPADGVDFQAQAGRREPWPEPLYREYLVDLLAERDTASRYLSKNIFQDLHDRAIVIWWSGLRTIEVDRLLWEDIEFNSDNGPQWTIRSPEKKGGVTTLPIAPILVTLLMERKKRGLEGPFRGRYSAMRRGWAKFKQKHPKYAAYDHHCMRHSFVTRMVKLHGREMASSLARHASIEMNQHYDHRGIAEMGKALRKESA